MALKRAREPPLVQWLRSKSQPRSAFDFERRRASRADGLSLLQSYSSPTDLREALYQASPPHSSLLRSARAGGGRGSIAASHPRNVANAAAQSMPTLHSQKN